MQIKHTSKKMDPMGKTEAWVYLPGNTETSPNSEFWATNLDNKE